MKDLVVAGDLEMTRRLIVTRRKAAAGMIKLEANLALMEPEPREVCGSGQSLLRDHHSRDRRGLGHMTSRRQILRLR